MLSVVLSGLGGFFYFFEETIFAIFIPICSVALSDTSYILTSHIYFHLDYYEMCKQC